MKTFSALLAFCAGNSPVPGEFPTQRPVTRSFDIFFDLCLNKGWVNNRDAGDLRRHRVHYDVIVMSEFPLTRSPLDPADPAGPGLPRCPCEKKKKRHNVMVWKHFSALIALCLRFETPSHSLWRYCNVIPQNNNFLQVAIYASVNRATIGSGNACCLFSAKALSN